MNKETYYMALMGGYMQNPNYSKAVAWKIGQYINDEEIYDGNLLALDEFYPHLQKVSLEEAQALKDKVKEFTGFEEVGK